MELSGEYTFDGPRETVWAYLQDPNVLTKVLPGCEELKEIGENQYQGAIKVKIGPIQGKFQGTIHLKNIVALEGYDIDISGQGAPGFVKGGGGLQLDAPQADKTHMTYKGDAQIGGRIANVGQRLIESSAKAIIRQSLDALNELIKLSGEEPHPPAPSPAQGGGEDAPHPPTPTGGGGEDASLSAASVDRETLSPPRAIPSNYTPPSQGQMALQVATDVANDFIPERLRPLVGGAAGGALVLVFYLLLKQLFGSRDE